MYTFERMQVDELVSRGRAEMVIEGMYAFERSKVDELVKRGSAERGMEDMYSFERTRVDELVSRARAEIAVVASSQAETQLLEITTAETPSVL